MDSFTKWLSRREIERRKPLSKKKITLEPLPSIEIPQQHIKKLGLRRRDGKFQALYFLPNKTLVVNNGQRCRKIPTSKTVAFSRWLKTQGIVVSEETDWLVVSVESAAGYWLGAEPALCLVRSQWSTKSMPMDEFLAKYGVAE